MYIYVSTISLSVVFHHDSNSEFGIAATLRLDFLERLDQCIEFRRVRDLGRHRDRPGKRRGVFMVLGPLLFQPLPPPFLPLALDGTLEVFDSAVDVVVARQEFPKFVQIRRGVQTKIR